MNLLRVPLKAGNFLTSWVTVSFWKRTLLHRVSCFLANDMADISDRYESRQLSSWEQVMREKWSQEKLETIFAVCDTFCLVACFHFIFINLLYLHPVSCHQTNMHNLTGTTDTNCKRQQAKSFELQCTCYSPLIVHTVCYPDQLTLTPSINKDWLTIWPFSDAFQTIHVS